MKKFRYSLIAFLSVAMAVTGCKTEEIQDNPDPTPAGDGIALTKLVDAISTAYATWEDAREIPESYTVDGQTVTLPEFIYAEASTLVALRDGKTDPIALVTYKGASNPDRDSYDKSEIAVTGGAADGQGVAEDLCTIAERLLATAKEKNQIPNQTLVYRGSEALAFSTDRATVTMARAISEYAASGALSKTVSTDYLSGSTTLKAFAKEFVGYLDVWENTVADILSSDGSHCEDNNTAWEKVHFVPIPQDTPNDWSKQGSQYDDKYQPYRTIEIEGTTYTAAQCWEIAIRGLMDMCTTTGQAFLDGMARNTEIPFGDGLSINNAPISKPSDACVWGKYPWYESTNDGGPVKYNGEELTEVGIDFILKCGSWHVVRSFINNSNNNPLGMIGNFQQFGTSESTLNLEGYEGLICPMREFLILARFYKYILDNNITSNVYTALKDVKVDFDLYAQELSLKVSSASLSFDAIPEAGKELTVTATEAWSAEPVEEWIHIDKVSGDSGETVVTVTVDNHMEETPRAGSIKFSTSDYTKSVTVNQSAYVKPAEATLMDFAKEFATVLDVWEATVGTVDADGTHNGSTAWTDVHFVPIINPNAGYTNEGNQYDSKWAPFWSAKLGEDEYSSNQCWEIAIRGLMDMCTSEGSDFLEGMTDRNKAYTLANGKSTGSTIPNYSSSNQWGANPWYEYDNIVTCNGEAVSEVGVDFILKCGSWHVVRSFVTNAGNTALGKIGNFQEFGTSSSQLQLDGYSGYISPMREFLILARIYKYIADNNITENVYDAIKDVKFDYDLYGVAMPDLVQQTTDVKAGCGEDILDAKFIARTSWTATASDSWISVDPASGAAASPVTISIKVAANEGAARTGKVTVSTATMSIDIAVAQDEYVAPAQTTLKEWAAEYVKCLDVWQNTVGMVEADGTHCVANGTQFENVHLIPIANPNKGYTTKGNQYDDTLYPNKFNVTIGGKTYTSAQCWEIAIRGLMNLVTTEGEDFLAGMTDRNKAYTLGNNASFSTAAVPEYTSCCEWGAYPWYENDDVVKYNGSDISEVDINFTIKVASWFVVRGLVNNAGNNRLGKIGNYQEFGTNSGSQLVLDGYSGYISPMRVMLITARIYKYLLDNNIDSNVYDAIKDAKFDFDLYHQESSAPAEPTLKDFAKSFVTCLDVWESTVGTVDADGTHNGETAWTNVHLLPIINAKKGYANAGNQYDEKYAPFWKATVGSTEYSSNQCWEIAIRGLMNMCTTEGEDFLTGMTDRNKAYTLGNGKGMDSAIPSYSSNNQWGENPWYEYDNTVTYNSAEISEVGIEFILKCCSFHVVRGLITNSGNTALGKIGNFQEFGTKSSQLNLDGYSGYICPMRELLIVARIYKYLLDNNIDSNVYDAIKEVKVAFDLY